MMRLHRYRRDVLLLIVGVLIGLCVPPFLDVVHCSSKERRSVTVTNYELSLKENGSRQQALPFDKNVRLNQHQLDEKQRRPKYLKDELNTRDPLYVGVVTTVEFLNTRAMDINGTWGHSASKVDYFVAESKGSHSLSVVRLEGVDDSYPPQKKVYRMLRYMHDNYIDKFNWFLRADDDCYVRVPEVITFLSTLDPAVPLYIGSPGLGRPEDLERIKLLPYERYCMGGPGVIFSRALLIQLIPHLNECLENVVVSYNEDLEVGRCISRRLGIQCTWAYEVSIIVEYYLYASSYIQVFVHCGCPNFAYLVIFRNNNTRSVVHLKPSGLLAFVVNGPCI